MLLPSSLIDGCFDSCHVVPQVVRNLHKSQFLAVKSDRVELQCARVVVADDSICRGCGRLLGNKVFYRYPSGVVLCSRCVGAGGGAIAQEQQQQ